MGTETGKGSSFQRLGDLLEKCMQKSNMDDENTAELTICASLAMTALLMACRDDETVASVFVSQAAALAENVLHYEKVRREAMDILKKARAGG